MAAPAQKLITLISSDNQEFKVEQRVAYRSDIIKKKFEACIETTPVGEPEPDSVGIPNVNGVTLQIILDYCKKLTEEGSQADLRKFDENLQHVSDGELHRLLTGARYLDIQDLVTYVNRKIVSKLKGTTSEDIKNFFGRENYGEGK